MEMFASFSSMSLAFCHQKGETLAHCHVSTIQSIYCYVINTLPGYIVFRSWQASILLVMGVHFVLERKDNNDRLHTIFQCFSF